MLLSTLPEIPGRTFEVRGFVFVHASLTNLGLVERFRGSGVPHQGGMSQMVDSLIEQARRLDADGIVDLSTVLSGDGVHCVMTGTAVRLQTQV